MSRDAIADLVHRYADAVVIAAGRGPVRMRPRGGTT